MSSISEANGHRSSPQSALQRSLAESDTPTLDLLFAPSHSSLDQYLADIPPPLRPQKSVNSFGSSRKGGDSRDPAHQQSHGEQNLPPATAVDSSTSSDGKRNDSESVETVYQQDPAPDWGFAPPTFLEPKTYRASASDTIFQRPRLKDLQPHAASDPSVQLTRIQQLYSEKEDTAWLPIQKPEAESSLVKAPKSSDWHAKDHEYSVLTPSAALPTPKSSFPSPTSETYSDDEYLAYYSGSTSLKDGSVSSPPTLYEKSHDRSFYVCSNCTRDKVYNIPYKPLGAGKNEAKAPQFGEKQFEEQIPKAFPAASSGPPTAKSSSRVKPQEGLRPTSPPYGPGNMYGNLSNLAPNSRSTGLTNPFTDPASEFPTSRTNIPAKAKQLLGIHPESHSSAIKNLPLRSQTKPSIPFLSKLSDRKVGNNRMLTHDTSSVQTGKKSTSLRRIIIAAFQPAGGKGITRSNSER